ncbi:MAG TPA: MFS transporter [Fimbriimonadaceae bacterium]|nr:MFS transporter [Fimbriimonadaceae bacterium]
MDLRPVSGGELGRGRPNHAWCGGLTGAQWLILLVAWLGWVFDVADTALFNFAKVPMLNEMLGKDYARVGAKIDGLLLSVFLVGWAVGGLVFGLLADRWGRTRTLVATILLYCLFTGLTALCRTPWEVGVARFLTALGIGGEWAAGAALVAEALPDRARAGAASFIQSAAAFGPVLAAVANLTLRGGNWRWLFVVGIVPAVLCLLIRLTVQEPERSRVGLDQRRGGWLEPIRGLFADREWRRNVIVAIVIGVVGIAGAGTATYWAPNLVNAVSAGLPKPAVAARLSYVTMLSHVGTLAGVFLVPWLCQIWGRKRTIFAFFLAAPLALLIGLASPSYAHLLIFMPLVNFFAIGVSAAFVLYFPELFPTRMRATGAGLAYNAGRLFYVPIPFITGALVDYFGGPLHGGVATGVILTGSLYVLGLAAIPFAPETKGKPLPA